MMYNKFVDPFSMKSSFDSLQHSRPDKHRIFVNRSLQLEKIRFYGFDMDYTLANYKSPQFEELCFDLIRDILIEYGYPEEFRSFKYESFFSLRGLWFDKEYGIFMKTDQYGNILLALIGFYFLTTQEIIRIYPNKFMKFDESRIYVMNTLFSLSEMYLLAKVIHWFTNHKDYVVTEKGVQKDNVFMSYQSIMQDVRDATDYIHTEGNLKSKTLENLEYYVHVSKKLPFMMDRLRSEGAKTFLLTNSNYSYTSKIMEYILSVPDQNGNIRDWTTYFDYIVVDAKKPKFFINGSILRAVDKESGKLIVGQHIGPLKFGQIYSGGSCEIFSKLIGSRGKDVLYVGDHIFGDILKSKKIVGWRTYLVIPEMNHELFVWRKEQGNYHQLMKLDNNLEDIYSKLNIESDQKPDVKAVKVKIKEIAAKLEAAYGTLGSLFRNGSRLTFFSSQIQRYADLYSASCLNVIHYPLCYMFRSQPMLLPHESAMLTHESMIDDEFPDLIYFSRSPEHLRYHKKNFMQRNTEEDDDDSNSGKGLKVS